MKFKFMFAVAALGLLATGCSNETEPGQDPVNGEMRGVKLTISTANQGATRAGEVDGEGAVGQELAVNKAAGLKVVVFNQNGQFLAQQEMTLVDGEPGEYVTGETIDVKAGNNFFFVFANDASDKIDIASAATQTVEGFVETAFAAVYSESTTGNFDKLDIAPGSAATDYFLLGSLWKETTVTAAGGTEDEPVNIALQIGRLSSKVLLKSFADVRGTAANEEPTRGEFSAPKYRLGSLALSLTQVGDNATTNTLPLGDNTGVLVTSAVHNAEPGTEAAYNATDFLRYNRAANSFLALTSNTANTASFYATENTSAPNAGGVQQFGNTTYIQIETKYTPTQGEVYAVVETAPGSGVYEPQALNGNPETTDPWTGGTFWTGYYNNQRLIFAVDPETTPLAAEIETIGEYTDGLNYHKFAIYDVKEPKANVATYNRVLRNHYYEYGVVNFKDLGSYTSDVDPQEPIPAETTVDLTVTVRDWDKVSANDVEL